MGHGQYSHKAHVKLTSKRKRAKRTTVFKQSGRCHPLMNPMGVKLRESRDSADHPESVAIVFALDVSSSMGNIPTQLALKTLPAFMKELGDVGVAHPQVMFMAVGQGTKDIAPLQVGQFESTAELMDQWLTRIWIEEHGGGGNESYELAMYFAARHTQTDCFQKRGRKGYFFVTGDEPPNPRVLPSEVKRLLGYDLEENISLEAMLKELSASYEPFFLIPDPGRGRNVGAAWRGIFGDRCIVLPGPDDTSYVAATLVALCEGSDLELVLARFAKAGMSARRAERIGDAVRAFARSLGKA